MGETTMKRPHRKAGRVVRRVLEPTQSLGLPVPPESARP
jgi:hypothetical protein